MRAARLRDGRRAASVWVLRDIVVPPLSAPGSALGGQGEGGVEGVEGQVGGHRDLEVLAGAGVLDGYGQGVLLRVPEQPHLDAVVLASGELAGLECRGAHGS